MIIRIASGKRTQIQEMKVKEEGKTLLSLMQEHNIYMDAPCNGKGSCGRCRVLFFDTGADGKAYDVPMPTEKEKKTLSEREIRGGIRLACCTVPMKDCFFEILETEEERIVVLTEENTDACGERRRKEANGEHRGDDTCRRKALRRKAACGGLYGIAVDVGTTTLAMELVNLESGKVEGVNTSINHQRMFGADVISRIQASNEGKGTL